MPKKQWVYEELGDKHIMEYRGDHLFDSGEYGKGPVSFSAFFEYPYVNTTMEQDCEIFTTIVHNNPIPRGLEPWLFHTWQLWRAIDFNAINEKVYELEPGVHFHFTKYGTWRSYNVKWQQEPHIQDQQHFHHLFFKGPRVPALALTTRREIRQSIWEALNHYLADFTLEDAFVLLDYEKVKEGDYWQIEKGNSGEYVRMHRDKIEIGGWSGPRDGGAGFHSLEALWSDPKQTLPEAFWDKIPSLTTLLKPAITQ
ncbi:hypothetical protein KKF84_10695 [Myxococcota bacterium]|nr:hypothetical protein [Myxococcota bacterium]MBU1535779.1 hypothetical protein [Myxococcota bacterium]